MKLNTEKINKKDLSYLKEINILALKKINSKSLLRLKPY